MTLEDNSPWFSLIPKNTVEKLLNPIVEPIGGGVGGVLSFLMNPLMKLGVISKNNMKNFEEKILDKNNQIPAKNRDDSKQGLALKALEDSVYQLDSEELQEMFSNLIASSLDNRKNDDVLPSFSSILKDLSLEDARLLNQLYALNAVATANIQLENTASRTVLPILENIMLFDDGSFEHQPVSVNTLNRLGLISIHKSSLVQPNFTNNYNRFNAGDNEHYEFANKQLDRLKDGSPPFEKLSITQGYITMTDLGKMFGKTVIN